LFGTIDQTLGHKRRFRAADLRQMIEGAGLRVERLHQLNKIGMPAWWLFGRVLHRHQINKVTLKAFDKTVWLWRRVDGILPWRGLSLVAVARVA
jgi:hypothetical protein